MPWDADAAEAIAAPPEEQRWANELSDVGRALYRLSIEQREALILITVGGFSYEEAAQISGAAVGTIKSRVARARANLAEILEGNKSLPQTRPAFEGTALEQLLAQLPRPNAMSSAHCEA